MNRADQTGGSLRPASPTPRTRLLRPRWLLLHAIVLVLVGLFALAGVWQLDRLDERRARNELIRERRAQPETALDDVMSSPGEVENRRVRAVGRYDTDEEVVLAGRSGPRGTGDHLLTPLVTEEGRAIVVDRGWVPIPSGELIDPRAAPPRGRVVVHGTLLPSEGRTGRPSGQPVGRLSVIDVGRVAGQLPYQTYSVYLLLTAQEPRQGPLPDPARLPGLSEGPHLVYAIQWFAFIAIAVAGYAAILRREARRRTTSAPAPG